MTVRSAVVAALVLVAACQPSTSAAEGTIELTIFGAASLQDALRGIESVYEEAVPGTDLVIATDSSAALRTQIEEGAPADVFLAADTSNAGSLVEAGLGVETVEYAGNSIALVVPLENPAGIASAADLATPGVHIIAAGQEVPITSYVAEVAANLAALPGYPAGFAEAYAANVVSQEDNVRGVLTKIELGEGDAGFVYQTDAYTSADIADIGVPGDANTHAIYAGCVITDSDHTDAAAAFLNWLAGPDGQAILANHGFVAP